jgi:NADP-dependent 3-hydroxy acid dehydrogenase YdfG
MSGPSPGVVIVSGATSGIGLACALDLCARGFTVVAGGRDPVAIAALERQRRPGLVACRLDVTDGESVAITVHRAEGLAAGRGLAGLVNNAGLSLLGPLELQPLAHLQAMLDVNVTGALRLTQQALPALRLGRGRIVFMGSIAGLSALPFLGGYSASKYALEAIADALRVEVTPSLAPSTHRSATRRWHRSMPWRRRQRARRATAAPSPRSATQSRGRSARPCRPPPWPTP